jgi:hypothetical protein
MEHRWNEIYRGKPKYSGRNLSQCHFVHHKSHMDWPGIEPGLPRWEAGGKPPEPWHGRAKILTFVLSWLHITQLYATLTKFWIMGMCNNACVRVCPTNISAPYRSDKAWNVGNGKVLVSQVKSPTKCTVFFTLILSYPDMFRRSMTPSSGGSCRFKTLFTKDSTDMELAILKRKFKDFRLYLQASYILGGGRVAFAGVVFRLFGCGRPWPIMCPPPPKTTSACRVRCGLLGDWGHTVSHARPELAIRWMARNFDLSDQMGFLCERRFVLVFISLFF